MNASVMKKRLDNHPIIFTHASRTGGGCLMLTLKRQYNNDHIYSFYVRLKGGSTRESLQEFVDLSDQQKQQYKVLGGHVNFGLHRFYKEYTYITLFRDPVKRAISLYSLALADPTYYLHNIVFSNNMTLRDFVTSGISPELDNGQTRMLAAAENIPFGRCSPQLLQQAKDNVNRYYPVFGITERYDETVLLLQRHFNWQVPYYQTKNVSKNNLTVNKISPDTIEAIKEINKYDLELYKWANAKFQEKVDAQGPAFAAEVQAFSKVNKRLQHYSTPRNGYLAFNILGAYRKLKIKYL